MIRGYFFEEHMEGSATHSLLDTVFGSAQLWSQKKFVFISTQLTEKLSRPPLGERKR